MEGSVEMSGIKPPMRERRGSISPVRPASGTHTSQVSTVPLGTGYIPRSNPVGLGSGTF